VVEAAGVDPVDQRPAERRTLLSEQVDRFGDEVGADRVGAAEFEKSCLNLGMKTDLPHIASISDAYIRWQLPGLLRDRIS